MSEIIADIKSILSLPLVPRQRKYYEDLIAVAKPVKISCAHDVLDSYMLDFIERVIKPEKKRCYRNAHLLCEAFPDMVTYCEGRANVPIPVDHAFNKVGEYYIDVTFEFALREDPSQYDYVIFGEYTANEISKIVRKTGFYGGYYNYLWKDKNPLAI